jgi:hypothetical protein
MLSPSTDELRKLLEPLSDSLPLVEAMPDLVPLRRQKPELLQTADALAKHYKDAPELQAAIWLYVDDLHRSHTISQSLASTEGALWHAVMHRREGDFSNSKYWLREAGDLSVLESAYGDPVAFVDRVQREHQANPQELVDLQRKEWSALFMYCARKTGLGGSE